MSSTRFWVRIVLSAAILAWVLYTTESTALAAIARDADPRYLLLGAGLYALGDLLSAKKLQLLLRVRNPPLVPVWKYYYVGKLFNSFLPTTIGGDAVKARKLERHFDDFSAYSAVFMERFTGVVALLAVAIVATIPFFRTVPVFVHLLVYTVFLPAVLAVSAVMWSGRLSWYVTTAIRRLPGSGVFDVGQRVLEFRDTVERYRSERRVVAVALVLSVAFHAVIILASIAFAVGVGMTVNPIYFFVFIPVASVVLFLPISIGGFGVREAIYIYFFVQVGALRAEAVSLALLLNGMLVLSAVVGALLYARE